MFLPILLNLLWINEICGQECFCNIAFYEYKYFTVLVYSDNYLAFSAATCLAG